MRSLRTEEDLAGLDALVGELHADVAKLLELQINAQNQSGNDVHNDWHKASSKTQNTQDIEPASKRGGGNVEGDPETAGDTVGAEAPLGLVLEACSDFHDWSESGRIRDWGELLATAERVRPMLGISPDAWVEARRVLGSRSAAIALGFILQRSEHSSEAASGPDGTSLVNGSPAIRSAGGYLRSLTVQAEAGELRLGPLLMALIGQRLKRRGRGG